MAFDCPQCRRPMDAKRSTRTPGPAACPVCGHTLVRDLADSTSLRRALHNVASVQARTPAPTAALLPKPDNGVAVFDYPFEPGDIDTDSQFPEQTAKVEILAPLPATAEMPDLPGYEIDRVLGRGGMGTVYLARQISLDRPVALKVMSRKWIGDPTFIARFTREAYAAARLNHPNLVQVYDIGEVNGQRYFSMEFVEGRSLADVVRSVGKLDPESAVGFILQAARGIKHAHDRGMIHRDIKPDNLLLDPHGIVKVADLGLVKTPGMGRDADSTVPDRPGIRSLPDDMTGARMALGTPAYMSPEQCRDAAAVDRRADIYSLGCTLYALVTGKQPFDGDTAVDLMSKHAYSPLVPPEEIAARVPAELSTIIQTMMAKEPDGRYATMADVIRVLENWLGVHHAGHRLAASEEQITELERCASQFQLAPTAIFRMKALTGFFSLCLLSTVVLTFLGRLGWAFGLAGLIVQAALVYFFLNGAARKTHLYRRVKQLFSGLSVGDWLVAFAMLGLFGILLWMLQLFWMWVGFGLIGAALAFLLRYGLDRTVDAERHPALVGCERLLRRLRVQGLDEDQLRFFVAKYAGRNWEEFFEALFGYEVKMETRARLMRGEAAGQRERFAAWREPLVALLVRIENSRRAHSERQLLVRVEEARMSAQGLSAREARRRAETAAEGIVGQAEAIRTVENLRKSNPTLNLRMAGTSRQLPNLQTLIEDRPLPVAQMDLSQRVADALTGPVVRAALAALCLTACFLWAWQNHIFALDRGPADPMQSLVLPGLPAVYTAWIDSANIGLAGVLLLTSLFYSGQRMGLLVMIGAAVAVVAHRFGIPAVEPIRDFHVGLMLGTVIALIGYRFGRR